MTGRNFFSLVFFNNLKVFPKNIIRIHFFLFYKLVSNHIFIPEFRIVRVIFFIFAFFTFFSLVSRSRIRPSNFIKYILLPSAPPGIPYSNSKGLQYALAAKYQRLIFQSDFLPKFVYAGDTDQFFNHCQCICCNIENL